MISIKKDYDKTPVILKSNLCRKEIKELLKEKGKQNIWKGYQHHTIRESLKQLYHNKCAYCESILRATSELRIDHYRPQTVKESPSHSGYYWLVYEWSNMLPACVKCNMAKSNHFPLMAEGVRVTSPQKDQNEWKANSKTLEAEKPLILNPELHEPEKHLEFLPDGSVKGLTEQGKTTIEILGLNRESLMLARKIKIDEFRRELESLLVELTEKKMPKGTQNNLLTRFFEKLMEAQHPSQEYSRLGWFMLNNFESFFTTEMREKRRRFVITAFNHFKDVYNIVQNIEGFELVDNKVTPAIGVEEVTAEVAGLIRKTKDEKGNMIGIFGRWGRGKTFLTERLWKHLEGESLKNVLKKSWMALKENKFKKWEESVIAPLKVYREKKRNYKDKYFRVNFHAWKFQDTPASWAYLYEAFADQYYKPHYKIFKYIKHSWNTFIISIKKYGVGSLAALGLYLAFIVVWYFHIPPDQKIKILRSVFVFLHLIPENTGDAGLEIFKAVLDTLGLTGLIGIAVLNFRFKPKAVKFLKKYCQKQSFSEYLGVQAEIQKELKFLLKAWIPKRKLKKGNKRILLFVEDIDRCKEERLIQIIDSLRVMLDDEEICKRVTVIAAVDEEMLKRAIQHKYSYLRECEGYDIDLMNKLISEYMDKLFLAGIKLGDLSTDEKKEIFDVYTKERGVVYDIVASQNKEKLPPPKEEVSEPPPGEMDKTGEEKIPEVASTPATVNLGGKNKKEQKQESRGDENREKYEISWDEYIFLKENFKSLPDATPRKIRILYYRYLLAKGLLNKKTKAVLSQEKQKNMLKLLPKLIIEYSERRSREGIDINEYEKELHNSDTQPDQEALSYLLPVLDMVVAY